MPFFEAITRGFFPDGFEDIQAAIDYTLAPGSDQVEIAMTFASARDRSARVVSVLHGFMYAERMPPFIPVHGFDQGSTGDPIWTAFADEDTSFLYELPDGSEFNGIISESGFNASNRVSRRDSIDSSTWPISVSTRHAYASSVGSNDTSQRAPAEDKSFSMRSRWLSKPAPRRT